MAHNSFVGYNQQHRGLRNQQTCLGGLSAAHKGAWERCRHTANRRYREMHYTMCSQLLF